MNFLSILLIGGLAAFASAVKQTEPGCPYPPEATLGSFTLTGSGYTQRARYTCNENTVKVGGSEILECENGVWIQANTVLKCRRLRVCPHAPEGWNVMVKESGDYHRRKATYECMAGYKVVGGAHEITCYDGIWETYDVLVCQMIEIPMCKEPPTSEYTLITLEKRGEIDYAVYQCEEGSIVIDGETEIYCTEYGSWSSLSILRCQKLRECPEPPTGLNSHYEISGQRWQQEAVYTCEEGYISIGGDAQTRCYDGKWLNLNVRRCRPRPECPAPREGVYSSYTLTGPVYASEATYVCDDETVYVGGVYKLVCEHGVWDSYDSLRCRHLRVCPAPPVGLNVKVSLSGALYDRTATYECEANTLYVSGEYESTCYDGIWIEHNVALCRKLRECPPAPEGLNSVKVESTGIFRRTATYTCVGIAVRITGESTLECYDGVWSGFIALRCRFLDVCPDAPRGYGSEVSVTGELGAQWASYQCTIGLVPISGKAKVDCALGKWESYDALNCKSLH